MPELAGCVEIRARAVAALLSHMSALGVAEIVEREAGRRAGGGSPRASRFS
ncbi:hypothetical protein [Thauera sp. WH-1]|uniref:hypothetical protein n=1 Tax=Thauera sp. WH-1 TaxID=3398230 RepID=UPI0039FBD393